ncbi:nuclear pore complex protein Nup58 isoform X2 [Contarinia nasturtii]|uniref:nuclear pore complex protein Nup58 isoform X2 n=1 Tax=Contarinia nasturtii TaxID=265458 RepID=UPI0012D49798|nr:nuclear pore complex protein Nup58 isoform X2 [Contarinia nasturtii]
MSSFTFGQPQTTAAASSGFAFGASTPAQQQPAAPSFAQAAAPSFGFSTPAAPKTAAQITATPNTTSTLTFGTSAPPYGAQTTTSTAAAPAFSFGLGATSTTSAPSLGLSFGASTAATTTQQTAPTFGAFGANTANTSLTANKTIGNAFGLTTTTTTATVSNSTQKIGLGGIDINAAQPKTIEGQTDSSKVKENQLPQEIIATVDSLKAYTNQQKTISSDIVRASSRKITNVNTELDTLNWALAEIHSNVETNFAAIKQLRAETNKARQEAEIAQRTHETPAGLQFENTAPLQYFMEMVQKFESDMLTIRKQLELTETHIRSLTNPQTFTADDLKKGLQQIHECFVALAGRLQETHRTVEIQHEQFLNLMKHRGRDKVMVESIYDGGNSSTADGSQPIIQQIASGCRAIIPNVACGPPFSGPTPFSSFRTDPYGITSTLGMTSGSTNAFAATAAATQNGFGTMGSLFGDNSLLNGSAFTSKRAK